MIYASFQNHIWPVLHYLFAFIFLFVILPRWIFSTEQEKKLERWFARVVKMLLLLILSGYLLVIIKLFEVLSICILFLTIIAFKVINHGKGQSAAIKSHFLKRVYDSLDGLFHINLKWMKERVLAFYALLKSQILLNVRVLTILEVVSLCTVIGIASYLRFYDAFTDAAPPMADSYVTLAWMKYIDGRELFHDGIYPQGFHIYLATLFKFAAVDALYVLRYTGPLNSVFFMVGLYFIIRSLTRNGFGAIVAAAVYGIMYVILPYFSVERQAATNSQEFAFIFIFPALYFFLKYLFHDRKEHLLIGVVCTTIIGLVHSLAFALTGMLIGIAVISSILIFKNPWRKALNICLGSLLAVGISLLPLGIGLLMGKGFHSSSAEYLVEQTNDFIVPSLSTLDYTMIFLFIFLLFYSLKRKRSSQERFLSLFSLLVGASVLGLYYAGGMVTKSTLIASRSVELWSLVLPFCLGLGISLIVRWLKERWLYLLYTVFLVGMVVAPVILKVSPVQPYKLEHSENIEQYFRIREQSLPKTWMTVSQEEGYAVSLGTGFHMHLKDFLEIYSPEGKSLTKRMDGRVDSNLPPDVFVFSEKKIFQVSKKNSIYTLLQPQYKRRALEYQQLSEWVQTYRETGNQVGVFFENQNIVVYHIQTSQVNKLLGEKVWNE